jgi:[acyl-carrier-protein] S-malonyltransferase
MKAFVFPGQGAQFVGMGKDLYESSALAKELFEKANDILGYRITDILFNGTDEDLRQTKVTQPAVFLHSVISALCMGDDFKPEMTAGHSLGEFSALVAAGALNFEDGLKLVYARAMAMQKAAHLLHRQWLPFWDWPTRRWKKSALQSKERFVCRPITTVRDKS